MEKNVGGYDRIARLIAGPILVIVGIGGLLGMLALTVGPIPGLVVAAVALVVGAVFVGTGVTQQCPLNSLLGINTCPVRKTSTETDSSPTR